MLNKIMLIGNLGRDPEMSYTPSGKAITKFSLAVNRTSRDRETNERREETTWFYIVAWDQLAETCNQYLHKGSKVYIEGRMTSRKYTNKDGVEVTAWEVVAQDMKMLDTKAESQAMSTRSGGGGAGASGGDLDPENDLPF
ncbi:MAG TPA: single-stranded DNA-binding protein [Ktedonobacterales bacterium]